mmetsp:Transcript_30870/g.38112  ORF Transcript_30870/g.38112 Transcript_30870/m.38112 type:complete len:111 (+) Transcript_30870:16-348(+)
MNKDALGSNSASDDCNFLQLTKELKIEIIKFLAPICLLRLEGVCHSLKLLDTNEVWRKHCEQRWINWPLYRMSESEIESESSAIAVESWKTKYRLVEDEVKRSRITKEEI